MPDDWWLTSCRCRTGGCGVTARTDPSTLTGTTRLTSPTTDIIKTPLLLLHPPLFQDNLNKLAPERKTSLYFKKAKDGGVLGCSGISWTICKQSALAPDRWPHQHLVTQYFYRPATRCCSWRPANNVKALKAQLSRHLVIINTLLILLIPNCN